MELRFLLGEQPCIADFAAGQMAVPVAMEMSQVGRDYERVAAHAVSIARRVVYLAGSAQDKPDDSAM